MKRLLIVLSTLVGLGISTLSFGQTVTYGFQQGLVNQLEITALAYPSFTSNDVTISTSVFTFLLPTGTVVNPSVPTAPASGPLVDITGIWLGQVVDPATYIMFNFDPNELQGRDVYQVVLQNSPTLNNVQSGVPIPLFSFELPNDCMGGDVEVLTNDSPIQMSIFNNLGSNFNNQMSMSIDNAPTVDIYNGNDPATATLTCPVVGNPDAMDDMVSTDEDTPVNINPLVNDDFGPDGPSTGTITIITPPTNGTAVVNNGGTPNDPTDDTIDYTPDPNYNGPDQITYEICDASGDCDQAVIAITVNPVVDLPDAMDDMATTNEDTPVNIDPLPNDDFGMDGPGVGPISIVTPPTNGFAIVNDNGTPNDPTDDTVDYTPAPNYNGMDQITYEICDASGDCDQAVINITVDPVNDLPIANDDNANTDEGVAVVIDVLNNDDFGGDGPGVGPIVVITPPGNGTAIVDNNGTPNDPTDDLITYTPNPGFSGTDVFAYQICDANGDCDIASVNVNVQALMVNDCLPPNLDLVVNVGQDFVTLQWTSAQATVIEHCWNIEIGGAGFAVGNGTALVAQTVCWNDPTLTIVGNTLTYTFDGLIPGTCYDWYVSETCDGVLPPFNNSGWSFVGPPFCTFDSPFDLAFTAFKPTCPEVSPGYVPNGSFSVTVTDPTTCPGGTYDLIANAVAASSPLGNTPPAVVPPSYLGVPAGSISSSMQEQATTRLM
jgi:hypothetical protein